MAAVRRERSALALALGIGDLAGALQPRARWCRPLSDLADRQLERALAAAIAERTPDAAPRGFAILALGKLGGRELNYSSDVDLIFLYDPETLPLQAARGARAGGAADRPARRRDPAEADRRRLCLPRRPAAAALARSDADRAAGRRRHLLLRIGGLALGAGGLHPRPRRPPAIRRSAAISSTRSTPSSGGARSISARSARSARSAAGSATIMRKARRSGPASTSSAAAAASARSSSSSRSTSSSMAAASPSCARRRRSTRSRRWRRRGGSRPSDAAALRDAYPLLRTIEHRLQMVDDRQTHSLPAEPAALDNVAAAARPGRRRARCSICSRPHVERVAAIYDTLVERRGRPPARESGRRWTRRSPRPASPSPARRAARIEGWRSGKVRSLRTAAGARGVRGDAAGADRGARRRARSDAGDEPLRGSDPEPAERGQFLPPARGAARPHPASRRDPQPRAGARRAAGPARRTCSTA